MRTSGISGGAYSGGSPQIGRGLGSKAGLLPKLLGVEPVVLAPVATIGPRGARAFDDVDARGLQEARDAGAVAARAFHARAGH
jgi:hypothetical protein